MPAGVILLLLLSILIYFGLLQRVLDRMHMTDSMAIIFIGAMIIGSFLPNIPLGSRLSINIGGGIIPVFIAIYLIVTAKTNTERLRSVIAAIATGIIIYAAGKMLPSEPETMIIDPIIAFGIIAGVLSYIFGRSRRGAFISGIMSIIINDIISASGIFARPVATVIGGAGVLDTAVISGIVAVGLCEIIGETNEKLKGGSWAKQKSEQKSSLTSMLAKDEEMPEEGDNSDE